MSHHHAYLTAMGITAWERRDRVVEAPASTESDAELMSQAEESQAISRTSVKHQVAALEAAAAVEHAAPRQLNKLQTAAQYSESETTPVEKPELKVAKMDTPAQPATDDVKEDTSGSAATPANGFLVLPKGAQWKAGGLTLICRHEPGQPAQSYVRNGAPSKTVTNLLLALQSLLPEETPSVIKGANFAQLSSTALSEHAVPIADAFLHSKPKAILVMGAAAANQLLHQSFDMGQWQARNWQTQDGIPVVVTYHPYEMFTSPILKKQVQKDLFVLRQWLIND